MNARGIAALAAAMAGMGANMTPREKPYIDTPRMFERKGTKAQRWRKYKHAMGRKIRARLKAGGSHGTFGKHFRVSAAGPHGDTP